MFINGSQITSNRSLNQPSLIKKSSNTTSKMISIGSPRLFSDALNQMRPVLNAHPDELERLEKSHSVMDAGDLPRLSVEIKSKRYLGEACFTKKNLDMTVPIKSTEFRLSDHPSEDHSIPPYKGFIASEDRQLNLPIKSISQKKSIIALTEHKRPKVVSQAHINSAISMAQLP